MTDDEPRPVRGRPVSQRSRQAALDAAATLLAERGYAAFTVDEVARRSRVGKATLYRHWPDGFGLAVEAYGAAVTDRVPVLDSGDVVADLTDQVVRLAEFYASERGRVGVELIAASVSAPRGAERLRDSFFGRRRAETTTLVERGQTEGSLSTDLSATLVVDVVFGAVVFRLLNGLGPLDPAEARAVAEVVVAAVATRPGSGA
ncbi:TetR/AcrR family transcriptional regulator [Microlunatus antarcticus]|uniref:AcrR family transcriptional regulator n=1 Tax=Microlunatus antarcticus TaxID=53388 RepID=A0A7W5JZG8_9ACTN|nr:TetR/AcrR family transcriptional regulator [Microlunatus antarcticus]MBB3329159.1 AcrR family transcriptional regulator [Microlunatus antarcticus]